LENLNHKALETLVAVEGHRWAIERREPDAGSCTPGSLGEVSSNRHLYPWTCPTSWSGVSLESEYLGLTATTPAHR
jgi:hypothetical protein